MFRGGAALVAEGRLDAGDNPEVDSIQRKLTVMLQVATDVEKRPRLWAGKGRTAAR